MPVPPQCKQLYDEIESLKHERTDLQNQLKVAPTPQKAYLAQQIKRINIMIQARQPALNACLGIAPPIPPLAATFAGAATMTTSASFASGPFTGGITIGLLFDDQRIQVFVTAFPDISTAPFQTPMGSNITTVKLKSAGSGSYSKPLGAITLPLILRFDHSLDVPFYEEDSDLSIVLSTMNPPGSPVTAAGQVTLSGTGVFSGGVLNGNTCTIIVVGSITPVP